MGTDIESGLINEMGIMSKNFAVDQKKHYSEMVGHNNRLDTLQAFLKEKGIASEVYYPLPPHLSVPCRKYGYKEGDFSHAEKAAKETLALPLYPEMSLAQQDEVIAAVREFVSK